MREILFRGKRTDTGEWVEGSYSRWKDGARMSHVILEMGDSLSKDDMIKWYVKPATVGQYTGLKDKNGKRIFEGDVVTWGYGDTVVEFKKMPGTTSSDEVEIITGWFVRDCSLNDECDIIGNVADNPELVEEL